MTFRSALVGLLLVAVAPTAASAQSARGPLAAFDGGQGGWYLRGDLGIASPVTSGFTQDSVAVNGGAFGGERLSRTGIAGVGVGWRINDRFRVDTTWELRSGSSLDGVSNITLANARGQTVADLTSVYTGKVQSQVALVNAYVDIGTWNRFTPFVGAGVGIARNTVSDLRGVNLASVAFWSDTAPYGQIGGLTEVSHGVSAPKTNYSLAWALMGGVGWAVDDRLTIEASYRYLNLGKTASTSLVACDCGAIGSPIKVGGLASHDLRVGARWALDAKPAPAPAQRLPVVAKY